MDQAAALAEAHADPAAERRGRILDAAERCFVRSGFHRTTMQDVAAEAGMSPGNLYRYFGAKDLIVAGLVERDRAEVTADFRALDEAEDFAAAFAALGRKHFAEESREKAVLCLEIWAEATRNPAIAALTHDFVHDMIGRIAALVARAQERGAVSAAADPRAVAVTISTLADGLFVRRALMPGFDPSFEVDTIMTIIGALLTGAIDLGRTAGPEARP